MVEQLFGPPTVEKFASILADALRSAGEQRQYAYDADRKRLTASDGAVLNLSNLHKSYSSLSNRDRPQWLRETCIGLLHQVKLPKDFDDAKPDLRPSLCRRSLPEFLRLSAEAEERGVFDHPSMQIGDYMTSCLVYDLPKSMRFVSQEDLDAWGVSFYEAMEVARQNLDENPPTIYPSPSEKAYVFQTNDGYDATRMLSLDLIRGLKIQGYPVALPVNRDFLLIASSEDEKGISIAADMAKQQSDAPRSICSIPHILKGDEWHPWRVDSGHPAYKKLHQLELNHFASEYAKQKDVLERWTAAKGFDVFVASYSAARINDQVLRYCVCTKGIDSWLPKADLVVFTDRATNEVWQVPWNHVVTEFGSMMEKLDFWPPRWRVQGFPPKEQLARLKEVVDG